MMPTPKRRVILLGASNVARSFPLIVNLAQELWQEPIEIMAAIGHGRSFGQSSQVFGRKISGIFSCQLWDDLAARRSLPTSALVTDIGNDLLYGTSPKQLLEWVSGCLDRLALADAQTIVSRPPVSNIERIGNAKFLFFRSLFFPRSCLTLAAAKDSVAAVDRELIELAGIQNITAIPVENEWYGLDPVHIRRRKSADAWREILANWQGTQQSQRVVRPSFWRAAYLRSLPPLDRAWLGVSRCRAQPSGVLPNGTTISLY